MVQSFHTTEIWKLWKIQGLPTVIFFYIKINFQGRDKLIFQNVSPNEFREVPLDVKFHWGKVC